MPPQEVVAGGQYGQGGLVRDMEAEERRLSPSSPFELAEMVRQSCLVGVVQAFRGGKGQVRFRLAARELDGPAERQVVFLRVQHGQQGGAAGMGGQTGKEVLHHALIPEEVTDHQKGGVRWHADKAGQHGVLPRSVSGGELHEGMGQTGQGLMARETGPGAGDAHILSTQQGCLPEGEGVPQGGRMFRGQGGGGPPSHGGGGIDPDEEWPGGVLFLFTDPQQVRFR